MTQPPTDIDPSADQLHELLQALQHKYRRRRRIWARSVGLPYSEDLNRPEPAVLDGADPEDG